MWGDDRVEREGEGEELISYIEIRLKIHGIRFYHSHCTGRNVPFYNRLMVKVLTLIITQ